MYKRAIIPINEYGARREPGTKGATAMTITQERVSQLQVKLNTAADSAADALDDDNRAAFLYWDAEVKRLEREIGAISERAHGERPEFPHGEFDNGAHWQGGERDE